MADETPAYRFEDQSLVAGVLAEINGSGPNSAEFRDARLILAALSAAGWGDMTALRAQLADVSDAHHEGFGAGVEWADERAAPDTPQTAAGALEAAIEAAVRKVRELESMTVDDYLEQRVEIDAAVRAAAPLIERDALLEAARAAEARLVTTCSHVDNLIEWLRNRAKAVGRGGQDREGE